MYGNQQSTELPMYGAKTLAVRNGTSPNTTRISWSGLNYFTFTSLQQLRAVNEQHDPLQIKDSWTTPLPQLISVYRTSGTVEMHGKEVTPKWTELGETAEAGATSIIVNTQTNWKVRFSRSVLCSFCPTHVLREWNDSTFTLSAHWTPLLQNNFLGIDSLTLGNLT